MDKHLAHTFLTPFCKSTFEYASLVVAIKAYRSLYQTSGMLQQDISTTSIIISADGSCAIAGKPKVILISLA
jgi:hypothetical protein